MEALDLRVATGQQCNMTYITNKYNSIRLPVEPGMLEWLLENYKEKGFPNNKSNVWGTHPSKEGHLEFATKVIIPHIKKHILNE